MSPPISILRKKIICNYEKLTNATPVGSLIKCQFVILLIRVDIWGEYERATRFMTFLEYDFLIR